MAIYITGDTHRDLDKLMYIENKLNTSKKDYLIVLGDFGFIWYGDKRDDLLLDYIQNINFTTLFIEGNHSNINLIREYQKQTWNGGNIHRIRENIIHLERGQVFNIEGKSIFTFGGARSIDKDQRTEGVSWWKEEMPSQDEIRIGAFNLLENDYKIDYILTHDCPNTIFNQIKYLLPFKIEEPFNPLRKAFTSISILSEFKHWYFGHYHIDHKVNDKYTAVYNNLILLGDE